MMHKDYSDEVIDALFNAAKNNERKIVDVRSPSAWVRVDADDSKKAQGISGEWSHWETKPGSLILPQVNSVLGILSTQDVTNEQRDTLTNLATAVAHELQHNKDLGGLSEEQYNKAKQQTDKMPYNERPHEIRAHVREGIERIAQDAISDDTEFISDILDDLLHKPDATHAFLGGVLPEMNKLREQNPMKYKYFLKEFYKLVKQIDLWQKSDSSLGSLCDSRMKIILDRIGRKVTTQECYK